ncbi:MAG: ABC transporter permease [Candidatus Krumholzibacteriia bacterium]
MPRGAGRGARRRRRGMASRVALGFLLVIVASAVLAPVLTPYQRDEQNIQQRLARPDARHPFGTDALGRDILTRAMYGGRISLGVAVISTLVALTLGIFVGATAGYVGGRVDGVLTGVVDLALSIPIFFLLLLMGSWWGSSFWMLCLVIGLATWMPVARLVRASTLSLRERDFVEAARALGMSSFRIVVRHILPNTVAPILVAAAIGSAQAILLETALGYLGFGAQPPTPTWGNMLRDVQDQYLQAPWGAVFPGLLIFLTVLALHVLSDALRDRLDPRLRT